MLRLIKNNWSFIVVLVICFWAAKSLLAPGFFPIHDDEQITRVFELDSALSDGQFPVRWVSHLGFGYGYPLFNFYPPFSYYSAEAFHLFGFSFIDSTKLVFFLAFLLSSFFMYLWVKEHFGKWAGVFAALLYTYAPFHAVEIYVRGSLPSFVAYAFLPAVFWSTDRLFKTKKISHAITLGFFIALIPLSHILILLIFLPFFVTYLIYLVLEYKKEFKNMISLLSLSLLVAFGLSAFFLVPSILEKGYTMVDKINTGELYSYKLHFVCIKEFFNSTWGYGGSLPYCMSGLSFEIGKVHLLFAFAASLFFIYSLMKKKISRIKLPLLAFFMFLFSIYMVNSHSAWIWDRVKILSYLQFPWRFLTMTALFSSFLGGFVIYSIQKYFGKTLTLVLLLVFSSAAVFIVISYFKPQSNLNVGDSYYTNLDDIKWRVSKASFEFVPKGVATKLSDIKTTQVDIDKKDIPDSPYKILRGDLKIKVIDNKSHFKQLAVNSKTDSQLMLNTFSFPGWKTAIDGKDVKYRDDNKLKLIVVDVPRGAHILTASFTNTLPRTIGNAISLVVVFNLVGFGLLKLWKKLKN